MRNSIFLKCTKLDHLIHFLILVKVVEVELEVAEVRHFPEMVINAWIGTFSLVDWKIGAPFRRQQGILTNAFYQSMALYKYANEIKDSQIIFSKVLVPVA